MKTKTLLAMVVSILTFTIQAQVVKISFDTITDGSRLWLCADTVEISKPNNATSGISWVVTGMVPSPKTNSIKITKANSGKIGFVSGQLTMDVYVYLDTLSPTTGNLQDTSFCQLGFGYLVNALKGNTNCKYEWTDGSGAPTNRWISKFGTYPLMVTKGCGHIHDTMIVRQHNSNPAPELGPNQTVCGGDTVVLDAKNPSNPGLFTSYTWSNGSYADTLAVTKPNIYSVETTDINGCIAKDSVQIGFTTPDQQSLCAAAFDSISQKNKLFWWADPTSNARQAVIFTKDLSDNMSPIDTVSYSSSSWTDYNSIPQNQQYEYSIGVIDTCNNLSAIGINHKTILLTIGQFSNALSFTWTKYMGTTVPNYTLYGVKANGTATVITTLPASYLGYNYNNFDTSYRHYYVGFTMPSCSQRAMINVRSNNVDYTAPVGIKLNENFFNIYPNPVNDKIFIQSPTTVTVKLMDITGKTLTTSQLQNGSIDVSEYPVGLYFVQLQAVNGGMVVKKVVKQ